MDRRAALEMLESARSDANDLRLPEFAEALDYLETDDEARETFARRREQDRQIAEAMQDVPVPEDLKARLLSGLANGSVARADAPGQPAKSRRRWLLSACVVMAGCLLAGLGIWFFGEKPASQLALHQVESEAPFDESEVAALPEFAGNFTPGRPENLWSSENRFTFSSPAKGFLPDSEGAHRVAVYEFFFRDPQGRQPGELRGVMLVLPKSELSELPESQSFSEGAYIIQPAKPRVAIRSWTQGDRVYICMVPIQHFEALGRVFNSAMPS